MAAPGCLLGGGGGGGKMHCTVAPALKCHASPEKVAEWGGLRHIFPPDFKFSPQKFHNGVGVSSSWSWLTTELTSKKLYHQNKKVYSKAQSLGAFTLLTSRFLKSLTFWSYHLHLRENSWSFSFTKLRDFLVGSAHVRSSWLQCTAFMHAAHDSMHEDRGYRYHVSKSARS